MLRNITLLVMSSVMIISCGKSPSHSYTGYLYFGAGNYLGVLNLSTGFASPRTSLGEMRIDQVSDFHDREFLISVSSLDSVRSRARVLRFNPAENRSREFLLGSGALFIPETDQVLFNSGGNLVVVSREDIHTPMRLFHQQDRRNPIARLPINGSSILLAWSENGEPMISQVDLVSGNVQDLPALARACDLKTAVWLSNLAQLLCRNRSVIGQATEYRLMSLDGEQRKRLPLPEDRDFRAVTYLEDQNIIVLSEAWEIWFSDQTRYAVWVYDLESGETTKLANNQPLGASVVYRPHKH